MDQEKIFEFILEIKSKLSSIDAKVDGILEQIKNHENRIQNIENAMKNGDKAATNYLGKALVISLGIIGSLTGATALILKLFSN